MSNGKIVKTIKKMIKFYEENPNIQFNMNDLDYCAIGTFVRKNKDDILSCEQIRSKILKMTGIDLYYGFDLTDEGILDRRNQPLSCLNLFLDLISRDEYGENNVIPAIVWVYQAKLVLAKIKKYDLIGD